MIHLSSRIFLAIALLGCISSSLYYFLCLWSAHVFLRAAMENPGVNGLQHRQPVSILKPLKGVDPEIYESFRSHCTQDYPEYEIIFGVSDPHDPAVATVERLKKEFPGLAISLVVCREILGPNVKVSNLQQMAETARYELLLVNDSDIRVEDDYLRRVTAPLVDERVGMVTCLYRGVAASSLGSRLEALGIATDFCAGVLAASQLERGLHFGLGSTLAFRRQDLEKIGGFRNLVDYLADDYELGRRISGLDRQVVLSGVVVETYLPAYDFRGFVQHQLRWFRGVRDARMGGYVGLVATFGIMWALIAFLAAGFAPWTWLLLAVVLLRFILAIVMCRCVLHDQAVLKSLWLLPLRDLIAVGVWMASFAGHTVTWRGDTFRLKAGRLTRLAP
ncbi:MAG TPA: bacteriohopanetetrol glucosamine biosynthesis glycosyltransferase HpnI [Candidatus Sulfotelmatobacter sp.]|jgi:ceramide glucosyltransferase